MVMEFIESYEEKLNNLARFTELDLTGEKITYKIGLLAF